MKNFIKHTTWAVAAASALTFASCDDMFEPAIENQLDIDAIFSRSESAWSILGNAYIMLPFSQMPNSDLATDDCVSNDESNSWRKMGTNWTNESDPTSQWKTRYNAIQYINIFLENVDRVKFAITDEIRNQMFIDHAKGEAYGLRALNYFHLLRAHAGLVNGEMYGVAIKKASESGSSNFNVGRDKLTDCIAFILEDIDRCMELVPYENGNVDDVNANEFIKKYAALYGNDDRAAIASYNMAFGKDQIGKMCGRWAIALRAQLMLWAASPAYSDYSGISYEDAAKYCAEVIGDNKLAGIDPEGHNWFTNYTWLNNLADGAMRDEFIWRTGKTSAKYDDNDKSGGQRESDNFPKSQYGNGRVNPTQNLVDAFPMKNGFPINHPNSGYDAKNIYANRDPRLADAVIVNGEAFGGEPIITGSYSSNNDGIDKKPGESTRTGYYLKKFLRSDVSLGENKAGQIHTWAYMRMTEFYLGYAEAANEAFGPTGTASYGMSAVDVIKALRNRAGVGTVYVDEIAAQGKEAFRELIRNERRIELCFENHRLYDLRRWKDMAHLKEKPRAIDFKSETEYEIYEVVGEERKYEDYMIYGPIPNSEVMKFSNIQQNDGWNK
ncbi:MAG: RagB/SusD family nutrient uptake outer membrane protein [Bacteroidia bacterium]|nr:RagB/SusD family nutrient uptake outer membrane protein [Bacteroidia bacterium]